MGMARVQELLDEARKALALREQLVVAGDDAGEVEEALHGLYHDLGRALVVAAEAGDPVLDWAVDSAGAPPSDGAGTLGDAPLMPGLVGDDGDEGPLQVPRPDLPRPDLPRPDLPGPDFPGLPGLDLPGLDPYDDSTPVIPPEREYTAEEPADYVLTTAAELRVTSEVPGSPFHEYRSGAPSWRSSLAQLLELMALPGSFADAEELAVESSRLQWASNQLAARLQPLPVDIRVALIAMMAARAQHLRLRLDSDVGPRLSLDRLQRYRLESDLPAVAGLTPTPRPETGSWEGDAKQWWSLLAGEEA
jgi:hypothetical protein